MVNLTDEEIQKLKASKSVDEWNKVCDEVKAARGGRYPDDWYEVVLASGLVNTVRVKNGW